MEKNCNSRDNVLILELFIYVFIRGGHALPRRAVQYFYSISRPGEGLR